MSTDSLREKARQPVPEEETGQFRRLTGYWGKLRTIVAVVMSVYAILYISRFFDAVGYSIQSISHRSLILSFLLTLSFLLLPARRGEAKDKLPWYDILLILIGLVVTWYNFFTWSGNALRYSFQQYYPFEIVFGFITVFLVLEATRRAVGLAMPLVALIFLLHMFLGYRLSGVFYVHRVTIPEVVTVLIYHDSGIYGIALGVAASVIVAFVIFSQFMFATGVGDFFIKFALSLVGHVRGGPAKVAVVASSLLGTITGATTANIAGTGVFTIPMMKRIGYRPEFAGAVETVASNGGQIMPPVMGTVAFLMAQWLGIRYWSIALVSFIPAFLYYFAVFLMVDAEAGRLGLRGMPRSECPPILQTAKGGWLIFLPLLMLVFLLGVLSYTPEASILYALGLLLLLSGLKWAFGAPQRRGVTFPAAAQSAARIALKGLKGGAINMLSPGITCACAGIIIGALGVTQIGLVLSDAALILAGDNQLLLLALAALACFILGMGMSSVPSYVMVVVTVAPALMKFGVPPLYTHLFVFWFALTSFITPPVAVGAYVAAGLAGANPMKTGWEATRLGICTFTLPFMFVYRPALLLQGSAGEIISAVVVALSGVAFLSWGLAGYFLRKENLAQRLLLLVSGVLFITMDFKVVIAGLVLGGIAVGWQVKDLLQERNAVKATSGETKYG